MLIEFSVENFRSFRTRQTFSMVAAPRLHRRANTVPAEVDGENFPRLLTVAAIYGPNASGKSSLVRALSVATRLTHRVAAPDAAKLPVAPFRFDPDLHQEPSKFEWHFIAQKTRYSFELSSTAERIHLERLIKYTKGRPDLLYERTLQGDRDKYEFGATFEASPELRDAWSKLTGGRMLFIAQAVANSSEDLKQLRIPFTWLSELSIVEGSFRGAVEVSERLMAEFPSFRTDVATLLSDIDIPIAEISVELPPDAPALKEIFSDEGMDQKKVRAAFSANRAKTTLVHRTALGDASFELDEESGGTKNLIGFALPWLTLNGDGKVRRSGLIVDEMDSSLHPKAVEALVRRHIVSDTRAQLIFTTHDTHLMDTKLLRRDQIWITERAADGSTQLRSIHEFQGRDSEDVEKRYYEGRYRGLPILRST
ncbi:ATP-binding protein [Ramlibacter sp. AN1015]|uniref:AAA family ATPase n=1 Tax=Ramlibacter sp. AN1015 TaxID=3133428 RepID=UPI0030C3BF13